jgi:hypothetical protein
MSTHSEIEQKLDELMQLPMAAETIRKFDAYFDSLSVEDRLYAATYCSRDADEKLTRILSRWLR